MLTRKHPDFAKCPMPDFSATRAFFRFGAPSNATFIRLARQDNDPDLPTPVSTRLFTVPHLPGMLCYVPTSVEQLFRLGSTHCISSEAPVGATPFVLEVGARAEALLLGEVLGARENSWHPDRFGHQNLSYDEVAPGTESPGRIEAEGYWRLPVDNEAPEAIAARLPDSYLGSAGIAPQHLSAGRYFRRTQHAKCYAGKAATFEVVYGVITPAEHGFLCGPAVGPVEQRLVLGSLWAPHIIGSTKRTAALFRETFLSQVPGQVKDEYTKAYDFELKSMKDELIQVATGVSLHREPWQTRVKVSAGWMSPLFYYEESTTMARRTHAGDKSPPGIYVAYPIKDQTPAQQVEMISRYLPVLGGILDGSLKKPGSDFQPEFYAAKTPLTLSDLVALRAAVYSSGFTSAAVETLAKTAYKVPYVSGGENLFAPSLDGPFDPSVNGSILFSDDEILYRPYRLLKEFFRRVNRRAEDLVLQSV